MTSEFKEQLQGFKFDVATSGLSSQKRPVVVHRPPFIPIPRQLSTKEGRKRKQIDVEHESRSSPTKRRKSAAGYLPPSAFEHLQPLQDRLQDNLQVVFCGINPGVMSATKGCHFGNPNNAFWSCLHRSGLTLQKLDPEDGPEMPNTHGYGLTDLVQRPSTTSSNLSKREMLDGVPSLLLRVAQCRPKILALVGFVVWDAVLETLNNTLNGGEKALKGVQISPAPMGWRPSSKVKGTKRTPGFEPWKLVYDEPAGETWIVALPSTSGLNTAFTASEKVAFFQLVHDALQDKNAVNSQGMRAIRVAA